MSRNYSESEYQTGCGRSDSLSVLSSRITVPTMLHGLWSRRPRRNYNKSMVPSTHMDERVEAVRRRLLGRGFTGIRRLDGTIAEPNRDYLDQTYSFWSDSFPNVIIGHELASNHTSCSEDTGRDYCLSWPSRRSFLISSNWIRLLSNKTPRTHKTKPWTRSQMSFSM